MAHGFKTGGRKKGTPNKKTLVLRQAAEAGITPLDYMLAILRDENVDIARRDDMAKAAAPYVHSRLAAVQHSGQVELKRAVELTDDELASIAAVGGSGTSETQDDPPLVH